MGVGEETAHTDQCSNDWRERFKAVICCVLTTGSYKVGGGKGYTLCTGQSTYKHLKGSH